MKPQFFLFALVLSFPSASFAKDKSCRTFPSDYFLSSNLSVAEIEASEMETISIVRKNMPDVPNVPFGFLNDKWKVFKSKIREGDRVIVYSASKSAWQQRAGETGYAILRSGCLVEIFMTLQS